MTQALGPLQIRPAEMADLAALDLWIPTGPMNFHRQMLDEQASGASTYLTVWVGNRPVAHANLQWDGSHEQSVRDHVANCPELNGVAVWPPELRSQGIGKQLVLAAEEMARAKGFRCLGFGVGTTNQRARKFYEGLGYEEWPYGPYADRWIARDEEGDEVVKQERCTYFTKKL
ncbi:MAG TPA: GNAT family N-acetyltransferase [Actinomycetota bacterium]|nr:GNAT family N-acetyltransferase [Actinomycetota bacterium]